ncbi:MAG: mechanosensitive ion channel family protein [Acidimicrobiia bacterium]
MIAAGASLAVHAVTTPPSTLTDPQAVACGPKDQQSWLCSTVYKITDSRSAAELADRFSKPLRILMILLIAYVTVRVVRFVIKRSVRRMQTDSARERMSSLRRKTGLALLDTGSMPTARRIQRAETIGTLLRSVASFVIWTTAILTILKDLGINLAPIIAGAGVVGIAIGFGAQTLVKDFLSGLFMLFEDQFGVGDVIDAAFAVGTVEGVSLRTTRLRDVDGVVWHIPNGEIRRVGNKSQQWSRVVLDFVLAYDTDVAAASDVIERAADATLEAPELRPKVLGAPEVWGVESVDPDRLALRLVVKTRPLQDGPVARALRADVKRALDAAGIHRPGAPPVAPGGPGGSQPAPGPAPGAR